MAVIRRNILNDSAVRDAFIRGVKLLKQEVLTRGGLSTYDTFVAWHHRAMMRFTPPTQFRRNAAHVGPIFLPWHRHMLILLERQLQRVLGDSSFGLPYWDWGTDGELPTSQQRQSALWAANCMGGDGTPVSSGPFAASQWQVRVEATPTGSLRTTQRGLRRQFSQRVNLPAQQQVRAVLAVASYDASPWDDSEQQSFRNLLEGWQPSPPSLHNVIHVWVGGDMGASTSPNDPVFYLNHANVDRIWAAWQRDNPTARYVPAQNDANAPRGHRERDPVFSIVRPAPTPADLIDVSAIYSYDTFAGIL